MKLHGCIQVSAVLVLIIAMLMSACSTPKTTAATSTAPPSSTITTSTAPVSTTTLPTTSVPPTSTPPTSTLPISTTTTPITTPAITTPTNTATTIIIKLYTYNPPTLTAAVGATVTWINQDADDHTATSDAGSPVTLDLLVRGNNGSNQFTFTKAGTYPYHCNFHAEMHGTIIVM